MDWTWLTKFSSIRNSKERPSNYWAFLNHPLVSHTTLFWQKMLSFIMKTLMSVTMLQSYYMSAVMALEPHSSSFEDEGWYSLVIPPVRRGLLDEGQSRFWPSVSRPCSFLGDRAFCRELRLRDTNFQLCRRSSVVIQYDWLDCAGVSFLQNVTYRAAGGKALKRLGLFGTVDDRYDLSDVWYVDSISDFMAQAVKNL